MDENKIDVKKSEPIDLIDKRATMALVVFWLLVIFIAALLFLIIVSGK